MAQPYRISIGVEIDANQAKTGAGETSKAVATIGTAADRSASELARLQAAAANGVRIPSLSTTGAELDRLRAKFNPMFATIQQYKAAQTEIRTAHSVGALSIDEMTAALSRNRQAALASIDAIKGRNAAIAATPVAKSANQGFAATNVMYQAQDIGVTAAMGMSPAMIGLQQGSQIAGAYAGMTLKEAASTTGAALAGLISPVSIAAIGLAAASAAAIQFGMSLATSAGETKTLDDALEAHQNNLSMLKTLYGDLGEAIKKAGSESSAFSNAQIRENNALMRSVERQQNNTMMAALTGTNGWTSPFTGSGTSVATLGTLSGSQAPFQSSVDNLIKSVRAGKGDLDAFGLSIEATYQSLLSSTDDPTGLRNAADAVRELGDNALAVATKYEPFQAAINRLKVEMADGKPNITAFQNEVEKIGSAKGLQKLADEIIILGKDVVTLNNAMREQAQIQDALDRRRSHSYGVSGTAFEADQQFRQLTLDRTRQQTIAELSAVSPHERAAAARLREQNRFDPLESAETRDKRIETAGILELARAEKTLADAHRERVKSINDSIEGQQLELLLIGRTTAETEALRMEYRLVSQVKAEAAKNGVKVDQEELALIREKSREYGQLAAQIAGTNLLRGQESSLAQLRVQTALTGANDDTRRRTLALLEVEQTLRDRGIATESAIGQQYKRNAELISEMTNQLRKQNEAWGRLKQGGEEAIDSLVDGLTSGNFELDKILEDMTKSITSAFVDTPIKTLIRFELCEDL